MKVLLACALLLVNLSRTINAESDADGEEKVGISVEGLKIKVLHKPETCHRKTLPNNMLHIHYTGTLTDGSKFDSR